MLNRLKTLRKDLGMSQDEFAKAIGMTRPAYANIERGFRPLSDKHINLICYAFNASETWIRFGTGDMYLNSIEEAMLVQLFSRLRPSFQKYILDSAERLCEAQEADDNYQEYLSTL